MDARGWRGYVPLLFADVCDYTALGELCDPEDVEQLLRELEALTEATLQRYGGSIIQVYGDGFLAAFGLPVPDENSARQALDAALELHEAVRAKDWSAILPGAFEVRLHTGVHSGLVFAREGDALRGKYGLKGEAVTTAARLGAQAGRDEIVASHTVIQGIEGFYDVELLSDKLDLKGKSKHVSAFKVIRRSSSRTRAEATRRRGRTHFVGRKAELSQLIEAMNVSIHGRGKLVVVSGAPGIGKSRLLEAARTSADGSSQRCFLGSCESYGEVAPLEPFRQVLDQLQPQLEELDLEPTLAHGLSQLSSLRSSEHREGGRDDDGIIESFGRLFHALASRGPIALLLDDWQWADDTSRKVLASLLRERYEHPLCVVVGTRELEASGPLPPPDRQIQLMPFDECEAARVVRRLRPQDLDLGVSEVLHRRAGGNPLFLEELCRALPEGPLDQEQLIQADAPTTLQGVIQARVARLAPEQAKVLRAAAVIGLEIDIPLLSRVVETTDLDSTLEELAGRGLLLGGAGDGAYRFKHGITREVVYETILKADRQRMHGAIAHAITERIQDAQRHAYIETLAQHYRGSGNHERAAEYSKQAGDRAMATGSLDRARLHYRNTLIALEQLPSSVERTRRWLEISMHWATACVYSPAPDQVEVLERAAAHADELGETGARAQTRYSLGWIQYVLGDYDAAIEHCEAALQLAEAAGAGRLRDQLLANLGQIYAASGRYAEALERLGKSIERKRDRERRGSGSVAQGFAYALGCRASLHSDQGDFEASERDIGEALSVVGGSGHAIEGSLRALQAMAAIHRATWPDALDAAVCSREIATRINSGYVFATSSAYEAYAHWKLHGDPEAITRMRDAVRWLERRGQRLFISFAYGCFADTLYEAGELDAARDIAERALMRADEKDPLGEAMACRTLARLEAAPRTGAQAAVSRHLDRAMRSAERRASQREMDETRRLHRELLGRSQVVP